MRILLAAFMATLSLTLANAQHEHGVDNLPDWYDPACCNKNDCRPVLETDIEFFQLPGGGDAMRYKPTGNIFPKTQWKPSQDARYHACVRHNYPTDAGQSLCAYIPVGI